MRCVLSVLISVGLFASPANSAESLYCKKVRFAETGWSDLAFTTGVAMVILEALGYEPETATLSGEVIYHGLKNRDIDVFLGYWHPAMTSYIKSFVEEGSVETLSTNLVGATYTFAVPTFVWEAGVRDLRDLHRFSNEFERKMFGIEAGSNRPMFAAIEDPALKLKDWEVVESSEAGMLSEVERRVRNKEFVVFQGWAPHPMNLKIDFRYLTGGDKFYGPDFGSSTVSTQVRQGYQQDCPNVSRFLKNLSFDVDYENKGMKFILDDGMSQIDAATYMIKAEPERLMGWLKGVRAINDASASNVVLRKLRISESLSP